MLAMVTLKSRAYLEELFPLPMVFNFESECRAELNKFGLESSLLYFNSKMIINLTYQLMINSYLTLNRTQRKNFVQVTLLLPGYGRKR